MTYFVFASRYDPGVDNAYETYEEEFGDIKKAEEFIKGLLNREQSPFEKSEISVICGERCKFLTKVKTTEVVHIQV